MRVRNIYRLREAARIVELFGESINLVMILKASNIIL
jgi:hypothetical protein